MNTVRTLNHIALKTDNVLRLHEFYSRVVGLIFVKQHEDEKGVRSVWLKLGDGLLMLERSDYKGNRLLREDRSFKSDPPGIHLLALSIDHGEKDDWRDRLRKHNVSIEFESDYTIYFFDPDGNRVGLSSFDPTKFTS